jgi:FMN phosphatase YigB (HAD superfamily)
MVALAKRPNDFKHLLVDLDGTLVAAENLALSLDFVWKLAVSLRPYTSFKGGALLLQRLLEETKKVGADLTNAERLIGHVEKALNLSAAEAERVLHTVLSDIFPKLERYFYPVVGAKDFIDWASGRYSLTLATNPVWPIELVKMRVKWGGLLPDLFPSMTHAHRMHSYKPSREYYLEILKQEDYRPEDCLLIGNEYKMDLPATMVGVSVFIVKPEAEKIRSIRPYWKGNALAWEGNFEHLRKMLSSDDLVYRTFEEDLKTSKSSPTPKKTTAKPSSRRTKGK